MVVESVLLSVTNDHADQHRTATNRNRLHGQPPRPDPEFHIFALVFGKSQSNVAIASPMPNYRLLR